jgi:hypothetical protein
MLLLLDIYSGSVNLMRNESEVNLKRAYWSGAFDTLNIPENARSDKLFKEKITAQTWLTALDWMLGQSDELGSKLNSPENKK